MLVLSRLPNEKIIIGRDVAITIVGVGPGQRVRLGIVAPGQPIDREEVRRDKDRRGVLNPLPMR